MHDAEERSWLATIAEIPIIGEVLMFLLMSAPVVALHFVPVIGKLSDGTFCIVIAIVIIVWISVLEALLDVRFVLPVIRLPWFWVWIGFIIYGVLQLMHVVQNSSQLKK